MAEHPENPKPGGVAELLENIRRNFKSLGVGQGGADIVHVTGDVVGVGKNRLIHIKDSFSLIWKFFSPVWKGMHFSH